MTKPSRATNVQVPGAAASTPAAAPAPAAPVASAPEHQPESELPATPFKEVRGTANPGLAAIDVEAMRAQIREEERAIIHAELSNQVRAASMAIETVATPAPRSKSDYRNMRATDIDPATLVAPVLTRDGYLCPPAPEAKK